MTSYLRHSRSRVDKGRRFNYSECGDNLDGIGYSRSRPSASKSFREALASPSGRTTRRQHTADSAGPWDELACWYWDLWDNIEGDVYQAVPDDRAQRQKISGIKQDVSVDRSSMRNEIPDIPPKPFRDELVCLYFKHVHPLCPVFDEVEFHSTYYGYGDDLAFLQCTSLLEFQAMMFAASLHLSSAQVSNTKYNSTFQCHTALFETVKKTYHSCHEASLVALTRAALLLSYWSPYNSEKQSNNYWVDQAFANAQAAHLDKPDHQPDHKSMILSPGRKRLIWWCCLLRDRLLAFGLRRTQCLHEEASACALICPADFGLEAIDPRFMDLSFKSQSIDNFIHQCKLSQMIERILRFQGQQGYAKDHARCEGVDTSEIFEITSLHTELAAWRHRFECSIKRTSAKSAVGSYNMPCQLTQIFCDSAIATLYLPYAFLDPLSYNPIANQFSETALEEVKKAASHIAKRTETLGNQMDSNDIPLALGAWITLPIAVKLVLLEGSNGLEDSTTDLQEMRSLMKVLYVLKHRFDGGRFVSNVLDAVISHILAHRTKADHQGAILLLQDAVGIIEKGFAHGIVSTTQI